MYKGEQLTIEYQTGLPELRESVQRALGRALHNAQERAQRQTFHTDTYVQTVLGRMERILAVLKDAQVVTEREVELGRLAALYYNFVRKPVRSGTKVLDLYHTDLYQSAEEARKFMEEENQRACAQFLDELYSREDKKRVEHAILSTRTVWHDELQTTLTESLDTKNPLASALALADVGVYGMDPAQAREEGRQRYRERYPDSGPDFRRLHLSHACGRKKAFHKYEIYRFPPHARYALTKLFSGFDESIRLASDL